MSLSILQAESASNSLRSVLSGGSTSSLPFIQLEDQDGTPTAAIISAQSESDYQSTAPSIAAQDPSRGGVVMAAAAASVDYEEDPTPGEAASRSIGALAAPTCGGIVAVERSRHIQPQPSQQLSELGEPLGGGRATGGRFGGRGGRRSSTENSPVSSILWYPWDFFKSTILTLINTEDV